MSVSVFVTSREKGFTLIEVLVTFLIVSIGLLGMAALQTNTMNDQLEAYQRAEAMVMVDDMAARLDINQTDAIDGLYTVSVAAPYGQQTVVADCSDLDIAARDLCEWNNLLAGASSPGAVGSLLGARGCIELLAAGVGGGTRIRVTVAWQGTTRSVPPAVTCGQGAYGEEVYRRAIFRDVFIRST